MIRELIKKWEEVNKNLYMQGDTCEVSLVATKSTIELCTKQLKQALKEYEDRLDEESEDNDKCHCSPYSYCDCCGRARAFEKAKELLGR